jgi:hypothetical protein
MVLRTDMEKALSEKKPVAKMKEIVLERSLYPKTW